MKLYANYHSPAFMECHLDRCLGATSIEELEEVLAQAEEREALPCPFCGGEGTLRVTYYGGTAGVCIECAACRIRTQTYAAALNALDMSHRYTLTECLDEAAKRWNARHTEIKLEELGDEVTAAAGREPLITDIVSMLGSATPQSIRFVYYFLREGTHKERAKK